ncbi:hypothetical protein KDE13_09085 [Campylobacter sp. faydin G-140]|uniref:hypothetical protein n=1 Tax=Campylobacter anatolicus TaxID=2829105 RepID=UPI001BA2C5D9|nr:hypothetical protein [Campylobacter anatolicus]MBR8466487.1 hypothetical protein [Campylobacter anatolicus]
MQNEIEILDDNKQSTTIYTQEINSVDFNTGELVDKKEIKFVKEKNRHGFIQIYIDNIGYLSSNAISNIERQSLIFILSQITFLNVVKINGSLRKLIKVGTNLSDSSVSRALSGLIEKNILLKIDEEHSDKFGIKAYIGDEYLVNPQLVGKGSFNEMKSLRQTVITDFDFKTLEMKQQIQIETKYDGFDEVAENLENHEIREIRQELSDDNRCQNTEIVIAEKDNAINAEIVEPVKDIKNYSNKELELKIINAQNEAKRLDIEVKKAEAEAKKAETENLKIRLELEKVHKQEQKTLFDNEPEYLPNKNDPDFL